MTDHYNLGSYQTSSLAGYIKPEDLAISRMVDYLSEYNMAMGEAVNMKITPRLDENLIFPKFTNRYILPERMKESTHSETQTIEYFNKGFSLEKWGNAVEATYEASIRFDREQQIMQTVNGCGMGFARARDIEILNSLLNGAGISVNASAKWDSASPSIPDDIGSLLTSLFTLDDADITDRDIKNMIIYYPMKLYPNLQEPIKMFMNTDDHTIATTKMQGQTDRAWAEETYGIRFRAIKDLNYIGKAIAVIPSANTADHFMLRNPQFKEVAHVFDEKHQIESWMNFRYFKTFIYPGSENSTDKSYKVMTLNTVCDVTRYPVVPAA